MGSQHYMQHVGTGLPIVVKTPFIAWWRGVAGTYDDLLGCYCSDVTICALTVYVTLGGGPSVPKITRRIYLTGSL